ncbi:hypothetical protein [Streptomyces sp. H27-D2]|uniref:hypothetical protein n=1 Tax=Streptomyces sp. H27-D2 TaxID=3046304 RepID=UPI002DBC45B5|nr:hypothetical protein [Streptomyces sp. H27-D2]MEC4019396.1 hypothetical protein [Streptomyces sp. H27-D2]
MTHDDTGPDKGGREDLKELAARCAAWLVQERDRTERELRSAYAQPDGVPHSDAGHVTRPAPVFPKRPTASRPSAPAAAAPLIGLLDRLAELPTSPDSRDCPNSPAPESPDPVLAWVRRTVLAALAASGVTPVDDSGPVDPARHTIVATRDDPSGRHCGAIAETVRPGYAWGESLLRHQEVVAYVPPEEQAAPYPPPAPAPAPAPEPSPETGSEAASEPSEEGGPPHDLPR